VKQDKALCYTSGWNFSLKVKMLSIHSITTRIQHYLFFYVHINVYKAYWSWAFRLSRWKVTGLDADIYWTVHHCDNWRIKNQLDATYYFIVLLIGSTCFGHYYSQHQELATMMLITTLVVSFLVCCMLWHLVGFLFIRIRRVSGTGHWKESLCHTERSTSQ